MRFMRKSERSAVDLNSRVPVSQSGLGQRRPTTAATAGRNPEACSPSSLPKTGRGPGWNPGVEIERAALDTPSTGASREADALTEFHISQILDVFRLLDRWDREVSDENKIV
jgi:hypothetical protein